MTDNAVVKHEPAAVDPLTMEVVDLATVDHAELVDVFERFKTYEQRARAWLTAVEDELVRRHGDRKAAQVIGTHEVDVDRGFGRVWDPEDLIEVVSDLVGRGLLSVMDAQGLVKEEPKVDGRKALALLNRVDGDALMELRRCFTWEQKGRAKVRVTPVVELEG